MNKPREWWFNVTWHGEYSRPISKEPFKVMDDDEIVPVIEKSAYDALAAENERLKDDKIRLMRDMGIHVSNIEKFVAANAELVKENKVLYCAAKTVKNWMGNEVYHFSEVINTACAKYTGHIHDALAAEKDDVFDKLKHCADMGAKLADEVIELRAANAELVEALRVTLKHRDLEVPGNAFGDKARQALAKHGGNK